LRPKLRPDFRKNLNEFPTSGPQIWNMLVCFPKLGPSIAAILNQMALGPGVCNARGSTCSNGVFRSISPKVHKYRIVQICLLVWRCRCWLSWGEVKDSNNVKQQHTCPFSLWIGKLKLTHNISQCNMK
jgi:hypothetical protein